ncbi:unnamed protein product, partial [Phaeothamnion confervicola]
MEDEAAADDPPRDDMAGGARGTTPGEYGWSAIAPLLARADAGWTGACIVDSVFRSASGEVQFWLFTTKSGQISSKRVAKAAKVADRFSRFALANPKNADGFVALRVPTRVDEPYEALKVDELEQALLEASATSPPPTLQCFLRPRRGDNAFLRASYHRDSGVSVCRVSPLYRERLSTGQSVADGSGLDRAADETQSEAPTGDDDDSKRIAAEATAATLSLVQYLEASLDGEDGDAIIAASGGGGGGGGGGSGGTKRRIASCTAEFLVDDNAELWLMCVPRGRLLNAPSRTVGDGDSSAAGVAAPAEAEGAGNEAPLNGGGRNEMPANGPDAVMAPDCGQSDWRRPTEATRPPEPAAAAPTGSPPAEAPPWLPNAPARGTATSVLVPLFRRVKGKYVATVSAASLPGLAAWSDGDSDAAQTDGGNDGGGSSIVGAATSTREGTENGGRQRSRWQFSPKTYQQAKQPGSNVGASSSGNSSGSGVEGGDNAAAFEERATQAFTVTARSVLIAVHTEAFLAGTATIADGDSDGDRMGGHDGRGGDGSDGDGSNSSSGGAVAFVRRWRQQDSQAQLWLAAANPREFYAQATVCGNCYDIVRKLDAVRAAGFGQLSARRLSLAADLPRAAAAGGSSSARDDSIKEGRGPNQDQVEVTAAGTTETVAPTPSVLVRGKGTGKNAGKAPAHAAAAALNGSLPVSPMAAATPTAGKGKKLKPAGKTIGEATTVAYTAGAAPKGPPSNKRSRRRKDDGTGRIGSGGGGTSNGGGGASSSGGGSGGGGSGGVDVTMLARFAVERDRMAREVGLEELGSPATSGVLGFGLGKSQSQSQRRHPSSSPGRRSSQEAAAASGRGTGGEVGILAQERRLAELEALAEARMVQAAAGDDLRENGGDDSAGGSGGGWRPQDQDGAELKQQLLVLSATEQRFVRRANAEAEDSFAAAAAAAVPPPGNSSLDEVAKYYFQEGFSGQTASGASSADLLREEAGDGSITAEAAAAQLAPAWDGSGLRPDHSQQRPRPELVTIDALRQRLQEVAAENEALRGRVRRSDEAAAAASEAAAMATRRVAAANEMVRRALADREAEHQRRELAMRELHSRQL